MSSKNLILMFLGSIFTLYAGVFLGDLGGVGGYDGVAPRWIYEKINTQPGNDVLFHLVEKGSIISLALGLLLMFVFVVGLIYFVLKKIKDRATNS